MRATPGHVPWWSRDDPSLRLRGFIEIRESFLTAERSNYSPEHAEKLRQIHSRLIEARRELDALIGDAYLRPRASIVPVHFLDLASAVEKLRWAEKEWRELDRAMAAGATKQPSSADEAPADEEAADEDEPHLVDVGRT